MGLAPFFDKAALAAATLLQGFDRERFAAALEAQPIVLGFDDYAALSTEGRTTLELATNLLARLYPTMALIARGAAAAALLPELESIARAVNPRITLIQSDTFGALPSETDVQPVALLIGLTPVAAFGLAPAGTVYVGSWGWDARLSTEHPVGCGPTELPFGAAAAACLGAANVFRFIFGAQLPQAALDKTVAFSTLSLTTRLGDDANQAPLDDKAEVRLNEVDLGELMLVGAGAVGQGALWTLVRAPSLRGTLHVVDGEAIDASNPQRYVLAATSDEGTDKAALASELVSDGSMEGPAGSDGRTLRHVRSSARAALDVVPHAVRWGQFLAERPAPWQLARVLVALDSARDRIAVQAALPKWIANAWTQPGDLGLSIHSQFGENACLACLYMPNDASATNEDILVAEAVGLAGQHMVVRQLLATGAPVSEDLISQMAAGLGVPVEPLLVFRGRPLRAFYSEAICGGVILRLQSESGSGEDQQELAGVSPGAGRPRDRAAMVPMAFQSMLAGILLATAAVAEAAGLKPPMTGRKAVLDLLRPLPARVTVPVAPHSSGKCLCQDRDYLRAFDVQWGKTSPHSGGAAHDSLYSSLSA